MIVQTKRWCLYSHSLDGKVFYVGVGIPTRAFERVRRNAAWLALVSSVSAYEITVHSWSDDRQELLRAESDLIAHHKPCCNLLMNGYTNPARNSRASEVHSGKVVAQETRNLISVARAGVIPNGWLGRSHHATSNDKVRAANLCYPIQCVESGHVYPSIRNAALVLGISKTSLRSHMRGVATHVRGMTFKRIDIRHG